MASARPQWPDLLDPAFRTIYGMEVKDIPSKYDQLFNVESSQKNIEKDSSASGLSKLVQKAEGDAITYEDPNQGYDVTYTHKTWGLGTQVTQEMWEDDQYGVMKRRARELARAKMRTKEQFAADIFNYGFTAGGGGSATFTAGDSVALFSASHTRTDGGAVQSNYTTSDLAEDSLEVALVTMRATLDDKGQLMLVSPDTLVVAPALEKEARILLDSTGRTGTANNDVNPYQGRLKLVVWDYLGSAAGGSDTAWFVMDSSLHKLNWFNRSDRGLEGPEYDFDTKTAKWSTVCRWSAGWSDWRGVYGSKGDNS
jgi:phage major head subunit gpT-like protein